jgi:hypothetical protein
MALGRPRPDPVVADLGRPGERAIVLPGGSARRRPTAAADGPADL